MEERANLVGNGGSKPDGRKAWHQPNNGQTPTWIYNGPSIRFLIGMPGVEPGPYADLFPINDYIYTIDQTGPFPPGTPFEGVLLRRGERYVWDFELRQNSIAEPFDALGNGKPVADGVLRVEINGWPVHQRSNLMLRSHPQMGLHGLWLDCFHGGQKSPDRDMPSAYQVGALTIATRHIGV